MAARRGWVAAAAAATVLTLVGCGSGSQDDGGTSPDTGTSSESQRETWDLVVLADSSSWGLAEAWAELIRRDEGVEVDVTDFAVGTQSGGSLLEHLRTEGDPQREAVREAEVISVWGGPAGTTWKSDLDRCFYDPTGTRPPTRVGVEDMAPYARLWRDILSEISSLRNGQPTAVRTRDLYVPVVSLHLAAGTAEACAKGFTSVSSVVRDATEQAGGAFIPVYRAFNGPDRLQDPVDRGLLDVPDLQHLSPEGSALMAELHHEAGYEELTGN